MGVLQGCTPRNDVLVGDLKDAIFAADFGDVIANATDTPAVYKDPYIFFQNTHPTVPLTKIARDVFARLADPNDAGALIRLSTGYGGGKTHTLIALYHLAHNIANTSIGADLLPAAGRPASVTVLGVDAQKAGYPIFMTHPDAAPRSLWGELAWKIGGAPALAALGPADDAEAQPDEAAFTALLPSGPILILLDELVIYMSILSDRGEQNVLSFLAKLASIVAKRPQTVLVVTDPAAQHVYAKETTQFQRMIEAAARLDETFDRKMSDIDPIGNESSQVIIRRLFDKVDRAAAAQAAAAYSALYHNVLCDFPGAVPSAAATADYARRIEQCYPFHPRLLDTAQNRLGALQDFQQSRGVLRLFARILRDIWDTRIDCELICAGDINWSSERIQADLIQRLNCEQFRPAINIDINRHAADLDGGQPRGIHRRAASALLLESLPLQPNSGLSRDDLTLAILRPGEAGPEPGEALDRLIGVCWHTYPMSDGRGWQFRYEPNIIKEIESRMAQVETQVAASRLTAWVQQYFGGSVFLLRSWPDSAKKVPDVVSDLQLALCDDEALARRVCAYGDDDDPQSPLTRQFGNAIVAIAPTSSAYANALERARRLQAAEDVKKDYEKAGRLKNVADQINTHIANLSKQYRLQAVRAFNRVILATGAAYTLDEAYQVGEDQVMQTIFGQDGLRKFLEDKGLIYKADDALDPDRFLAILPGATPIPDQPGVYTARAVHERFLSAPKLRLVRDGAIVRQSIIKAVAQSKLLLLLSDGSAYDALGAVRGPTAKRTRDVNALPPSFALDAAVLVGLTTAPTAVLWTKTSEPKPSIIGEGTGPQPVQQPPAPRATAYDWPQAQTHAATRPLLSLKLKATTPAAAATLLILAQPLGANKLALSVVLSGQAKEGGSINFSADDLAPTHPIHPLQTAQTLFNSLGADSSYEAILSLDFGDAGRSAVADLVADLAANASPDIRPEATFGKPGVGS